MAVKEIFLLGNPKLYEVCIPVKEDEVNELRPIVYDLHDTLFEFKRKYNAGRAIAAPQIGVMKRLIYMNIDKPVVIINPQLSCMSEEMFELWDDCMSFPDLYVRVKRHRSCSIEFRDIDWNICKMDVKDSLSELLQHEYDHLDGILAVSRAIDGKSFMLRSEKEAASKP